MLSVGEGVVKGKGWQGGRVQQRLRQESLHASYSQLSAGRCLIGPCDPTILRGLMPDRILLRRDLAWPGVRWVYRSSMRGDSIPLVR